MSNYVIDMSRIQTNDGVNKPKTDIDTILKRNLNFKIVHIDKYKIDRIDRHFLVNRRIKKALGKYNLNEKDVILISYPLYSGAPISNKLIKYLNRRNVKVIAFIHDIDSLRFNWSIFKDLDGEINYLNKYDCVISHNKFMTNKLRENGLKTIVTDLEFFDYLAEGSNINEPKFKNIITFAGNLNKSKFLRNISVSKNIDFDVYGNIDDESVLSSTLSYKGSVSPEMLSKLMGKGFGLVWDGNSTNEISGDLGKYLKYNNPYKASAYINAGMPIIVWEKSAISDFVKINGIGLVVSNINNLDKTLQNISDLEFKKMIENTNIISNKIKSGYFTTEAVGKSLEKIKN